MAQNSNQFNITNEKGTLTLIPDINVVSVLIDANETATLVPGDAVVLKDIASSIMKVEVASALTDDFFGFVLFNQYIC